ASNHAETSQAKRHRAAIQSARAEREITSCRKIDMSTRRKNVNQVDAASLARWIVITGFLALAGLCYVYLTLQLHRLGDRKKILETELANIRTENDLASVQVTALTSRSALQRRLKEGYLKMVPITEQSIVRLAPIRPATDEDAIRPVANDRIGK